MPLAANIELPNGIVVRQALTKDVPGIRHVIDSYAADKRLLVKEMVTLYEQVQEFLVATKDDEVIGCGALHVIWDDLAEIRTLGVLPGHRQAGLGGIILELLVDRGRALGVSRLFCLTFETEFFGRHGFNAIDEAPVDQNIYEQLLKSYDEGVAEMLGLEHVKPNTLGNTRMLRLL
ncbi:MAG: Amino-acid acetyltransferase [Actinomycetota bacterium]|jgi:amino-acid N-acetyltransferase